LQGLSDVALLEIGVSLQDFRCRHAVGDHLHNAARTDQRQALERLCRYVSRPAIAKQRLSLTPNGNIRYQLKTPYRDGTTHVIFEPLDSMYRKYGMPRAQGCAGAAIARLAALVPKPRVNLTRFHGGFAPNSKYRARVTPAQRGSGGQPDTTADPEEPTPAERRAAMSLKRNASSGSSGSISTPRIKSGASSARPAAGRCGSPLLRILRSRQ
jgi:hypothetical protein